MHFAVAVLGGAGLGAVGGGACGFAFAVLLLTGKRAANRARLRRGEPAAKYEVRTPMEAPGALVGAVAGGVYCGLYGLRAGRALAAGALACGAALVLLYAVAFVMLGIESLRARQR